MTTRLFGIARRAAWKRSRRREFHVIAIVVLAALVGSAVGASSPAQAASAPGSVSGTVYGGSVLGDRQVGVKVELWASYCNGDPDIYTDRQMASSVTDGAGRYSFTDVASTLPCLGQPAPYWLKVSAIQGTRFLETRVDLSVGDGSAVQVDLVRPIGASVSGVVTSRSTPSTVVPGATVTATSVRRYPLPQYVLKTVTDAAGRYSLLPLIADEYTISVSAPGYADGSVYRTLAAGEVVADLALSLPDLPRVAGRVSRTDGSPLAGIVVTGGGTTATSGADGRYVLGPFNNGVPVTTTFTDPQGRFDPWTAPPVQTPSSGVVTVDAVLVSPSAIAGHVTANGSPVVPRAGVSVTVMSATSPFSTVGLASTDANGNYRVAGVRPGSYLVTFRAPDLGLLQQWWRRSPTQRAAVSVLVTEGQTTGGIDALMDASTTLANASGTVSLQSYPPRPEKGAKVELVRPSDGVTLYTTTTDTSGSFTFKGILSGKYNVRFAPANQGFLTQWLGGFNAREGSRVLSIEAGGSATGIDIALKMKSPFTVAPVPTISGPLVTGELLTATPGTWTPTPDVFTYQWYRNGIAISNATSSTYRLSTYDAGKKIAVSARGSKGSDTAQTKMSANTAAIVRPLTPGAAPALSGSLKVGSTLTATMAGWGPSPVELKYSWKRDGKVITTAKTSSYVLQPGDHGTRITVTITVVKSGYQSVSKTTAPSSVVVANLTSSPVPTIAGSAVVGSKVGARPGTWGPAPVTLVYQWKRNGVAIAGATKSLYTVQAADKGAKLTVAVTGSKPTYITVTRSSAPTATVR